MAYSKSQIGGFLAVATVVAVIAVQAFGVPLGTLLVIGLILCFPLVMLGRRGRERDRGGESAAAGVSEAKHTSWPGDRR